MVHPSQQRLLPPHREPPLSLTVALRGGRRVLPIRPWLAGSILGVAVLLATSLVGSAAYLIYRDDLLGAAVSRQVEMQYSYEERIATLRSELDRVTSRHIVQSEGVEQQLATLLSRQDVIDRRQVALDTLIAKARAAGIDVAVVGARLPRARPQGETPAAALPADSVEALGYLPSPQVSDADQAIVDTLLQDASDGTPDPGLRTTFSRV